MHLELLHAMILFVLGCGASFLTALIMGRAALRRRVDEIQKQSSIILEQAQREADAIIREAQIQARQQYYKVRVDFDHDTHENRSYLESLEKRLSSREENIDRKADVLEQKEKEIEDHEKHFHEREKKIEDFQRDYDHKIAKYQEDLQKLAGLTREEARQIILETMREEISPVQASHEEVKAPQASEVPLDNYPVLLINLPSNEMKGRVIGREGRNIRTLEMLTGVELLVEDETCRAVIWAWDPFRRQLAKRSLEQLISNGKIFPRFIEEIVGKCNQELTTELDGRAQKASQALGIADLHPQLAQLLGKLSLQVTGHETTLDYCMKVAQKMAEAAPAKQLDALLAQRIGLLHLIGKALAFESKKNHAQAGGEVLQKYNENEALIQAIQKQNDPESHEAYVDLLRECTREFIDTASDSEHAAEYVQRLTQLKSVLKESAKVMNVEAMDSPESIRLLVQVEPVEKNAQSTLFKELSEKAKKENLLSKPVQLFIVQDSKLIDVL